jgi:hypothetical protein
METLRVCMVGRGGGGRGHWQRGMLMEEIKKKSELLTFFWRSRSRTGLRERVIDIAFRFLLSERLCCGVSAI